MSRGGRRPGGGRKPLPPEQKRIVLSRNLTDLADEPEGICLKDGYAYVVFHTSREPRHAKLWRFSLQ